MSKFKLEFDGKRKDGLLFGVLRCPECGEAAFGGTNLTHTKKCSSINDEGCIYVIAPSIVEEMKKWAAIHGEESLLPNNPICLKDIKEQLPHLLE